MGDNENLLSISQKLLKKISNRNLIGDNNSESGSETMDSPEISSKNKRNAPTFFFILTRLSF